tara:strand:- start:306 stop:452 length:147 start_codon:yes stop_codon:yes gene_type:complete
MEKYFFILIGIPIVWMLMCLGYQLGELIYIWMKSKWSDIKDKETSLWD